METTGIVRKIDDLGRIVLPKELRALREMEERDAIEIFVDGDSIILKKYRPSCIFCSSREALHTYQTKTVCKGCAGKLVEGMRPLVQPED